MENILSTVTWVAPLILTIIFSGLIPLLVHWHRISRKPIIRISSFDPQKKEKDYALSVSLPLDELTKGKEYRNWYRVVIKNMDGTPILLKGIRANKKTAKIQNYIYVMPGEEMLITLPQALSRNPEENRNRVIIDSFTVDIQGKDAKFRIKIKVSNPDTSAENDIPKQMFPKYEICGISWRPF